MKNPLVSINITTFNRVEKLKRCLDAVLQQSYKNLEIIIADDCSPDNTANIVQQYIKKDSRIKYFRHNKNMGNAFARNTALKNGTGKYVAFLDDDDEWIDKDKIKKQVSLFEQKIHQATGIICSNAKIVQNDGKIKESKIILPRNIKKHILKRNSIILNSTVFTKRKYLLDLGGFDEKLPRGIDSDYFRGCIVKLNHPVFLLNDITTKVYEDSRNRITALASQRALTKHIISNVICIKKYFFYLLHYPSAFIYRLMRIAKALMKKLILFVCFQK